MGESENYTELEEKEGSSLNGRPSKINDSMQEKGYKNENFHSSSSKCKFVYILNLLHILSISFIFLYFFVFRPKYEKYDLEIKSFKEDIKINKQNYDYEIKSLKEDIKINKQNYDSEIKSLKEDIKINKQNYDSEIKSILENITILEGEINQQAYKLNGMFSKGMIIA